MVLHFCTVNLRTSRVCCEKMATEKKVEQRFSFELIQFENLSANLWHLYQVLIDLEGNYRLIISNKEVLKDNCNLALRSSLFHSCIEKVKKSI